MKEKICLKNAESKLLSEVSSKQETILHLKANTRFI